MQPLRIAHMGDVHIGFARYDGHDAEGVNLRAVDVRESLFRLAADLIAKRPDVIVIPGDLLHHSHPDNRHITEAFDFLRVLSEGLPGVPIIVGAGNHDTTAKAYVGQIYPLFRNIPNVWAVWRTAEWIDLPQLDLRVLVVPFFALKHGFKLPAPEGKAGREIMVVHTGVDTSGGKVAWQTDQVKPEEFHAAWDYIAIGDFHVTERVSDNAWFSGSMDYTAANIWAELEKEALLGLAGKGWLMATLDDQGLAVERHALTTRPHIDLPTILGPGEPDTDGLSECERDDLLQSLADAVTAEMRTGLLSVPAGSVVRQRIVDLPRSINRLIDRKSLLPLIQQCFVYLPWPSPPAAARVIYAGTPSYLLPEVRQPIESEEDEEPSWYADDEYWDGQDESLSPATVVNLDYDGNAITAPSFSIVPRAFTMIERPVTRSAA